MDVAWQSILYIAPTHARLLWLHIYFHATGVCAYTIFPIVLLIGD